METKIYTITDPEKDRDKIVEAAEVMKNGGIVAFPTDTVYAVGASISRVMASPGAEDCLKSNSVQKIIRSPYWLQGIWTFISSSISQLRIISSCRNS